MNFNNFTIKAQETVQKSVSIARSQGNQAIEPVHLLKAIMTEGDSVMKFLLQKLDIPSTMIERPLDEELKRLPHVNGGEPYLSNEASAALEKATEYATHNGDQYVSVEAMIMGLFLSPSPASTILKNASVTEKDLTAAITDLRKGKKASQQNLLVGFTETVRAVIQAQGPGREVTSIPASIHMRTSSSPGSEIAGVPASVIKAIFLPSSS